QPGARLGLCRHHLPCARIWRRDSRHRPAGPTALHCARQTGPRVVLMGICNAATSLTIHGETDMHLESRKLGGRARLVGALLSLFILGFAGTARGAEGLVPFDGEKSSWHGFD